MLTLIWKIAEGHEEVYEVCSVAKMPAAKERSDQLDCGGRAHLSFQRLTAVQDDGLNLHLVKAVIDMGEVFVMNSDGKTIAMYRFDKDDRPAIAA